MAATIQALERALDILETVGNAPDGMQVKDISAELGLNKSTVSRMLSDLMERGYVRRDRDHYYRLGMRVVDLCSNYLNSVQLKTEAFPYLERLRDQTGLTVHLGILSGGEVVYMDKISSFSNIRMYSQIGKRAPVHSTGLGRVMLSGLADTQVRKLLEEKGMAPMTARTMTDPEQLLLQLQEIRSKGYAVDEEENEEGMRCVAAPIRDYRGNVIAAVSVTGFVHLLPKERTEEIAEHVKHCAGQISECMGYREKKEE